MAVVPVQFGAHAKETTHIEVKSEYFLNRYGYATINETVTFSNNLTSPMTPPTIQVGLGDLSSKVVSSHLIGPAFTMSSGSPGGPFVVEAGQALEAGKNATFTISALLDGVVSKAVNGSLEVLTLSTPSLSLPVQSIQESVVMPEATAFASPPAGLAGPPAGGRTYTGTLSDVGFQAAVSSVRAVKESSAQDFHPLEVYRASRTVSVGADLTPLVTDSVSFKNAGTTTLSTLYVLPLTSLNGQVTVIPAEEPRLLNPVKVTLADGALGLASSSLGYPVAAGSNFTIVFRYQPDHKYYSVSGGQVTLNLPETPPIPAFVDAYAIKVSVPGGVSVLQGPPQSLNAVSPWQTGTATVAYALAAGWAVDAGIPAASVVFVLLLIGLFVSRTTMTEEEETEEESSTERASDMIKAFEEKTSLVNGLWPEIAAKDPNELSREYFDELRGRLDAFRSRALQRLNEVKQKSTTQKFFDLLNQIHATEREVDRAAKDKLNLYEQFYMKRMRKDVYDRLLPQYTKRLERALNQLSDELHVVQRESKLL